MMTAKSTIMKKPSNTGKVGRTKSTGKTGRTKSAGKSGRGGRKTKFQRAAGQKELVLKKSVPALEIPLGNIIALKKGTRFRITQNLGGAFTVFTKTGHLARVEGRFAEALGQPMLSETLGGAGSRLGGGAGSYRDKKRSLTLPQLRKRVKAHLKNCYDPEIPVNVLDLGLICDYQVRPLVVGAAKSAIKKSTQARRRKSAQKSAKEDRKKSASKPIEAGSGPAQAYAVNIKMTLTMPGCGMGDVLAREIKMRLMTLPGVKKVEIELVMDPPWDQSRLSPAARLQLGL